VLDTEHACVLAGVFAVHVLAILSPGPNVLVVTQTAASRSRRAGVAVALGIAVGAALWSSAVLAGLALVFAQVAWLYRGLAIAGGAYLVYLGVRLWIGATQPLSTARAAPAQDGRAFRVGLLTNVTNPKALVFYGSVFAALVPPATPIPVKLAAVALVFANSAAWHVAFAWLFSTADARAAYGRAKRWIDRVAGAALGVAGLRLLWLERP
jgi:threonine efflux protein